MSNFSIDGVESKSLDRMNNTEFTKWRGKKFSPISYQIKADMLDWI